MEPVATSTDLDVDGPMVTHVIERVLAQCPFKALATVVASHGEYLDASVLAGGSICQPT